MPPSDRLLTLLVSAMKYHPIPLVGNICRSPTDSHCEGEPSDRLLTLLVSAMKYHPIPLVGNICRSPTDSHCEGEKQGNSLQLSPNCAWFAGYIHVSAMKYHPIPLVGNICRSPTDSHCEGEKQGNSLQLSPNCAWFAGYIHRPLAGLIKWHLQGRIQRERRFEFQAQLGEGLRSFGHSGAFAGACHACSGRAAG